MLILGMNETTDQLPMANSARWHGQVLRREDGHVLITAIDFEVEGQWRKGRSMRTLNKQVEEESVKIGLRKEDALCRSNECWRKSDCCWVELNVLTYTYIYI